MTIFSERMLADRRAGNERVRQDRRAARGSIRRHPRNHVNDMVGDRVTWNSEAGASAEIVKVHTAM